MRESDGSFSGRVLSVLVDASCLATPDLSQRCGRMLQLIPSLLQPHMLLLSCWTHEIFFCLLWWLWSEEIIQLSYELLPGYFSAIAA